MPVSGDYLADPGRAGIEPGRTDRITGFRGEKMRTAITFIALLVLADGVQAQADPDLAVKGGGTFPAGWMARVDRPDRGQSTDQVVFTTAGNGFHVALGPHVILWNPANEASGNLRVTASFAQSKQPAGHGEAFGLLIGGRNLQADDQTYLYFIIRKAGDFEIRHRSGSEIHDVVPWTLHEAVMKPDAEGRAKNTLTIEAGTTAVRFFVNGTEVASLDRKTVDATGGINGIAGLRFSHNLDVHIAGFRVDPIR
jgi:hypothetical protein